jgi:hypothetical protein
MIHKIFLLNFGFCLKDSPQKLIGVSLTHRVYSEAISEIFKRKIRSYQRIIVPFVDFMMTSEQRRHIMEWKDN